MAGASLSTLSNILKEYYLAPIQDQFNNEILITQLLPMDSENLEGLEAYIPLHTGRSGGLGSRGENVKLPDAGNQAYKKAVYNLKYHYARVQVSGPSISNTKSDAGAFAQALKEELNRIKDDVMLDFARQLYGTGDGVLATIPTAAAANVTQTLGSAENISKGLIYVGMHVDVGTLASPSARTYGYATINDVDVAAGTETFDQAITPTNGDSVFRAGSTVASGTYEMDAGLQKLIATSANTVGNIDSSAAGNKIWQNLSDNVAGAMPHRTDYQLQQNDFSEAADSTAYQLKI